MQKAPPIESFYKQVESIVTDISDKYKISPEDSKLLVGELTAVIIKTHNSTVKSMVDSLIPDVTKLLERHGYKKEA